MTERRLEEMMLATIALFFLFIRRAVKRNSIWGGLRRLLTSCQLDIDFNTLAAAGTKRTALTAGRQRRRTELEAEETGESELETTIKQFLSSRLYGIAVELRGNVFNLRPPASSKRREKKKKQGEKSQIA